MSDQPSLVPPVSPISSRSKIALTILVLVVGVVGCLMLLQPSAQNREYARTLVCASNLKALGRAIAVYAQEHDGRIPNSFDEMSNYLASASLLICPSTKDRTHWSYEFTGGTNVWGVSSNIVVLRETEPKHYSRRHVLFDDGSVLLNTTVEH